MKRDVLLAIFLGIGLACSVFVASGGSSRLSPRSRVVLEDDSDSLGAYAYNVPSKNPLDAGFDLSRYVNSGTSKIIEATRREQALEESGAKKQSLANANVFSSPKNKANGPKASPAKAVSTTSPVKKIAPSSKNVATSTRKAIKLARARHHLEKAHLRGREREDRAERRRDDDDDDERRSRRRREHRRDDYRRRDELRRDYRRPRREHREDERERDYGRRRRDEERRRRHYSRRYRGEDDRRRSARNRDDDEDDYSRRRYRDEDSHRRRSRDYDDDDDERRESRRRDDRD